MSLHAFKTVTIKKIFCLISGPSIYSVSICATRRLVARFTRMSFRDGTSDISIW